MSTPGVELPGFVSQSKGSCGNNRSDVDPIAKEAPATHKTYGIKARSDVDPKKIRKYEHKKKNGKVPAVVYRRSILRSV